MDFIFNTVFPTPNNESISFRLICFRRKSIRYTHAHSPNEMNEKNQGEIRKQKCGDNIKSDNV